MTVARPSRSALRVALRRAAHQIYDRPLVFPDPLAVQILGHAFREELRRTPTRRDRPFSVALRAFLVARSRFAEDTLAECVLKGTVQYVLLGAGLDTFSYRNPYPELRVFEVDQPETQRWKRGLIASGGLSTERSPTYLALDFELEELLGRLVEVGFDAQKKTLFAWLGVVPYLTQGTFRSVLDLISGMPPGSGLVADYLQPRDVLPISEQQALDSIASRVREAGEPFRLFLTQGEIKDELVSFSELDDLGAEEINAMYFSGRDDLLAVRGAASRLIRAWV